jgi:hypothetical protein
MKAASVPRALSSLNRSSATQVVGDDMASSHTSSSFILATFALSAVGCQGFAQPEPTPVVLMPTPVFAAPQQFVMPAQVVVPSTGVPGFPESYSVGPQIVTQPGAVAPSVVPEPTTAIAPQLGLPVADATKPGLPNPLKVPVTNHDYAWDQIADVVSDYFPIASEQRVHIDPQMWTEGRIETPYQIGATAFEPQRKDSVGGFNLWQSTLQTIRRRAVVRVVPEPDGYLIDLQVVRELEDLPRPEAATAGAATYRNDSSLPIANRGFVSRSDWSQDWIMLGRDVPLEQKMLGEMRERLSLAPQGAMTLTPTQ